jgi:hypothetical protein
MVGLSVISSERFKSAIRPEIVRLLLKWARVLGQMGEFAVYVGDPPYPSDFDPYFNQPKIYRQPRYLRIHEQEEKRRQSVQD